MPWDRKRLLGYVETMQLILGVTDKLKYLVSCSAVYDCGISWSYSLAIFCFEISPLGPNMYPIRDMFQSSYSDDL